MIDWANLLFTALWTLGLAALLAALSLAHWLANRSQRTLRQTLMEPPFRLALAVAFVLVALGAAFGVKPWWHKIAWAGVLALAAWEGVATWRDWPGRAGQS
jgi:hypothetical protein